MLFFVPNKQVIQDKHIDLKNGLKNTELLSFTNESIKRNLNIFWTSPDLFCSKTNSITIFNPQTLEPETLDIKQLNDKVKSVLFKYVGSINKYRSLITPVLDSFEKDFKGNFINDIDTMRFFFDKKYLLEFQEQGFNLPKTKLVTPQVSLKEILEHSQDKEHIIKPLSGELSVFFDKVSNIDENWLREKESHVSSWLIQEFSDKIWNGEYQLVFFGEQFSHGLHKNYSKKDNMPSQNDRAFNQYTPTQEEINLALELKKFVEEKLNKKIYYFRFDFLKQDDEIEILEFEAVNPGFFFTYLPSQTIMNVSEKFIDYLSSFNKQ